MRRTMLAVGIALVATTARAENWVSVFENGAIWSSVDKDSVRRGADGLVYFRSDGPGKGDRTVDCRARKYYTLRLDVIGGIAYPKWRDEGYPARQGSAAGAELDFLCSHG